MPKYTAKQSIGHFMPGDEIKGLEAKQLQALLSSGAIEEYQELEEPKADNTAARLAELEKANIDLTKANTDLEAAKTKAEKEVDELKAKVAELEKAKPATKPKADPKPADENK
ncbi:hypothetical protein [Acinetobacter sp. SFA]|uniref:hypothetical protein n=1 Tax=Acinetobacter sp. SFA TaxID=1805633 RepID=UPI0007D0654F|nr:hypothetical protein [Acinetobacter sp. SFA]OAL80475.1 hypothetical protein AY607_01945 [Acinetobacter sp. SFA]